MKTLEHSTPFVLGPADGERLRFLGNSTMRLALDLDGGEDVAFYEYESEPGVDGPPQHVHHGHDETFYVVEGRFEFTMGAEHSLVEPGGFVFVPRGTPHTFRNACTSRGRIVGTFTPGRFADYFRELSEIIARTGEPPAREEWAELYGRYDTAFYDTATS